MRQIPPRVSLLASLLLLAPVAAASQQEYSVASPDGGLVFTFTRDPEPRFRLDWRGQPLILPSNLGLVLESDLVPRPGGETLGADRRTVLDSIRPVVPEKRALIVEHYNELSLTFEGGWGMDLRAFDGGVAYRFRTDRPGAVVVVEERFQPRFPGDPMVWIPTEDSFLTHQERLYQELTSSGIPAEGP